MDKLDEIKSKLSIVDVVSDYVTLKKSGRNFKALSPFHSEKTPSFVVSPEKGIAYCFSSHRGGDIFKFIQEIEGVDFPEALKILAEKAGVPLDEKKYVDPKIKSEKSVIFQIHEDVMNHYKSSLWDKVGIIALNYLHDRGLNDETIQRFKIGYAKDSFEEVKNFFSPKYNLEILKKAGLLSESENGKIYDKFRNRIMFPIFNYQNLPVAFTGRVLADDEPKYLNSPDTLIFDKSNVLYGFNEAKDSIKENDYVIIVEGQMDVLMSHMFGVKNVIAVSGTALTEKHLNQLSRLTSNVCLCFDSDLAGRQASYRACEMSLSHDMYVEIIELNKKDPADVIKEDAENWKKMITNRVLFIDYFINSIKKDSDINNLKVKKVLVDKLLILVKDIKSEFQRTEILRIISKKLNLREEDLRSDLDGVKSNRNFVDENVEEKNITFDLDFFSVFLLTFPQVVKIKFEIITKFIQDMRFFLEKLDNTNETIYTEGLNRIEIITQSKVSQSDLDDTLIGLKILIADHYGETSEEALLEEVDNIIDKIIKYHKGVWYEKLKNRLKEAEVSKDNIKIKDLEEQILRVINL